MSNGELRGGSTYSIKSSMYKLEVKRPNIKELKDGPIANHTSILAFVYRQ